MFEPAILPGKRELQYSCDLCGELPISCKRWCCDVCEDFDICDTCHATSMQMKERGVSHPGPHSPDHPCTAYKITESAEPVHDGSLKAVMANAIERWFVDTLRNAKNGDANQAALLSEMLSTGYGCTKDAEEARYWKQVARNGGARRVVGVYDELP